MLNYRWKRLMSGLLALVLVIGMLPPVAVGAEEPETEPTEVTEILETEETTDSVETEPAETETEPEETEAVETEPVETEPEETMPEETAEIHQNIVLASDTALASGTCGDNLTWVLDGDGTLTISGLGDMENYTYSKKAPWASYRSDICTVVISSGVTGLGNYAFESCRSLTSIKIPDSVSIIGYSAFENCASLTDVNIPSKVTYLSHTLFSGCSALSSITIHDGITEIGYSAFEDCTSLSQITIPTGVTCINHSTFSGCSSLTSITIPDGISSIGNMAFSDCSNLESIAIPDSVSSIGQTVFSGCSNLKSVILPKNVTSIGAYAFSGCTSLIRVDILGNITSIGDNAFSNCSNLTGLTLPNSIKTIGNSAFYSCTSLADIIIPENVVSIGYRAFYGCANLVNITIPSKVNSIDKSTFSSCSNLVTVTIQEGVSSIGDSAFYGCSSLTSIVLPTSISSIGDSAFAYCEKLDSVTFSAGITSIGEYAFRNCKCITIVTIPEGVTNIGAHAFDSCSNLTTVSVGNGISDIKEYTFAYCTNLTNITIPDSVSNIESSAFRGCSRLTKITLPEEITGIGDAAFYGCSKLTEIELPDTVTSIGESAFYGCSSLANISLPESVVYIGNSAFYGCRKLTSIVIPKQLTNINPSTFYSCSKLSDVTIPVSVTTIGDSAFRLCSKLQNVFYTGTQEQWDAISIGTNNAALTSATVHIYSTTVVQPTCTEQGYTYHSCLACDDCYADNYVDALGHDFQEYVPYSDATCFDDATEIAACERCGETDIRVVEGTATGHHYTSNSIAPSCTEQGYTIHTCSSCLDSYTDSYVDALGHDMTFIEAVEPTYLESGNNAYYICGRCQKAFKDVDGIQETTVEAEVLPKLEVVSSGTCGENLTWVLDSYGTLTISGTGAMTDYNRDGKMISDSPFASLEINRLVFEEGITHIGNCAFTSCTGDWGTVVLPESLESIGDEAFHRCTALTGTLVIPKNVKRIAGSNTAASGLGGNRLTSISVAEGNQYFTVYDGILYTKDLSRLIACPGQKTGTVTFPANLKRIDSSAFFECIGLTGDLNFPEGLQRICMWAFYGCSGLNGTISLPDNLQYIELSAFVGCTGLTGTVTLPHGVYIDRGIFQNCTGLTEAYIPGDVTFLGDYIFGGCTNMQTIYFDGTEEQWNRLGEKREVVGMTGPVFGYIPSFNVYGEDFGWGALEFNHRGWECMSGTLTIDGTDGAIPDYSAENPAPWARYSFQNLVIDGNITHIGSYSFRGHTELTNVTFNNRVTSIGTNAFDGCTGLQKVDFYGCQEELYAISMEPGNDPLKNASAVCHFLVITGAQNLGKGVTSGQSTQLTARMMPEGTVLSPEWYLPEEYRAYASLSDTGVLTAKTVSKAVQITVWAIQDGYGRGGTSFWILPKATSLTIDQGSALTVDMHEQPTLTLTATVSPADASQAVTWSTSNKSVATVDENGTVTLLKPGTVTITATTADGSKKTAKVTLTVYYADKSKTLTASVASSSLQPGQTTQVTVKGTGTLDTELLEFASSNTAVATVDSSGVVTAGETTGTATITATIAGDPLGRKASCTVTVVPYTVESLKLMPTVPDPAQLDAHNDEPLVILDGEDVKTGTYSFTVAALGVNYRGNWVEATVTWASGNTAIATVKDNGDGTATVTVKKGAGGECAITATAKDLGKVSANLWLSVRDYAPRLESTSLSMNLYQSSSVKTSLQESYGNAITDVSVDEDFSAEWADGILTLTANTGKGTYTETLYVTCENGETYEYALKITVTETAPTITVKQTTKYNLFYTDGTATLTVTAKGGDVENVTVTEGDFNGAFENGVLTLTCRNVENPSKKVTLEIQVAGYEKPVTKTVTLSTVTTAPKLKLTATSSIINTALSTDPSTSFQIINSTTGDVLNPAGLVSCDSSLVTMKTQGSDVVLTLNGTKGGTVTLSVQAANWAKAVKLTHKITVQTALPTLKLGASTLKLNRVFPELDAETTVSLSQSNLTLADVTVTPKTTEAGKIDVSFENGKLVAQITDETIKAGTYSYTCVGTLESGDTLKAVTLKITVSATTPKVKLASSTMKLNRYLAGQESISTKVTVPTGYTLEGFDGLENTPLTYADGYLTACLSSNAETGGTYTIYPILTPDGGCEAVTLTTGLKVKVTTYNSSAISATVTTKGKLDTLNPDSAITCTVKLKNCAGTISGVSLSGQDGELFHGTLNDSGNVILTLKEGEDYATNKTYKVNLDMLACGQEISKTISFKVTQSSLKVTASPATVTSYQALGTVSTKLTITSPATAEIEAVTLGSKTAAAFRNAFGDTGSIDFDAATGQVTLTLANPGLLTPGKNYTVYLEVTPKNNATNSAPTQVKLTVKVQK